MFYAEIFSHFCLGYFDCSSMFLLHILTVIITLSCFSVYFLGLLSFFFLKFCRGGGGDVVRELKLDEGGWVIGRIGHWRWRPTYLQKDKCVKICNSQCRDQNYVWCNFKQTIKSALSRKVAILNWGKSDYFTVQPLPLVISC